MNDYYPARVQKPAYSPAAIISKLKLKFSPEDANVTVVGSGREAR